jgi:subtilisin family serine protease
MPLKVFHADGTGNISDIVRAIYYATDNGAKVINMSFSSRVASPALTAAIQYADSNRVIAISSAGNEGRELRVYPASSGAIGVASTNHADLRSSFSNYGEGSAKTAAPGEALITSYPGGNYAGVWGTSFSSALVSGTAALIVQVNAQANQGIMRDALHHGQRIGDQDIGDARLDALSVVQSAAASADSAKSNDREPKESTRPIN